MGGVGWGGERGITYVRTRHTECQMSCRAAISATLLRTADTVPRNDYTGTLFLSLGIVRSESSPKASNLVVLFCFNLLLKTGKYRVGGVLLFDKKLANSLKWQI